MDTPEIRDAIRIVLEAHTVSGNLRTHEFGVALCDSCEEIAPCAARTVALALLNALDIQFDLIHREDV